jgi:transposase
MSHRTWWPAQAYARLQKRVRRALLQGSQSACPRRQATCANLLQLWPALWTFVTHPEVEPTNNDAARAIRPQLLKHKISGPSRSRRGKLFIAHSFSVVESCRRQGRDLIEFTHRSILAWIEKTAPPGLVPVG